MASIVQNGLLFPTFAGCVYFTFWDCCKLFGVVLATIGPRMAQEIVFPIQAMNRLCECMYAVVGLRTVLE